MRSLKKVPGSRGTTLYGAWLLHLKSVPRSIKNTLSGSDPKLSFIFGAIVLTTRTMSNTYKEAGVNIDAGNEFIEKIKPFVKETYTPSVLSGVGGFAAHVAMDLKDIKDPVLVSSTDGVGTKLKIAQAMNKFDTIGIDLVAMCINDIACSGARPLFFLDYFAMESLRPDEHSRIIKGIADGCKISKCALIGGETAELPGIYQKDDFDLAGFAVGIIDRNKIIDGSNIGIGNTIIGVESSGIHSNGYSLVRKIISDNKIDLNKKYFGNRTFGEIILEPTKIYSELVQNLIRDFEIHGIAHITGGGIVENVPRILPKSCSMNISFDAWQRPEIFDFLQKNGKVDEDEMKRVFNLGIGLVLIVPAASSADIVDRVHSMGEMAHIIGEII